MKNNGSLKNVSEFAYAGKHGKTLIGNSSNIGTDQPFFLGRRKGTAGRRKPP